MSVTIHPRSVWAEYVINGKDRAAAPPAPSDNPDWSPVAGVFIHYRGPALPNNDYNDHLECVVDIAGVYEEHTSNDDFNGDIAYNFLICKHGEIYEGRGFERGEANHCGHIGIYGRNSSFYSICAVMRADHTATEPMLRAFRDLIQFLRTEAPVPTGTRILPHSFHYEDKDCDGSDYPETDCPGNLTMYAQPGSTIDPAAPWTGLADIYVYAAQKWVNATYQNASGYIHCAEDGRTGWGTVLSFTQGLQQELGISPTVQSFGPGTFNAVKAHNTLPQDEINTNLVHLYNGALWCKGYWTSRNLGAWTQDSETALRQLYTDAGLSWPDTAMRSKMWPHICKALMRMDQFKRVPGGDVEIQHIQQRLNARYVAEVGIPAMGLVPCDGYYSRDVQQGFMMALQYELGIALGSITGYFGPATQSALRGRGSGTLTGDLRYLFRSACYFNSPTMEPDGSGGQQPYAYKASDIGTDFPTGTHQSWVQAFQRFSQIPVTGTNDYTTWAQLLVSSGDTDRPATGSDCITEITAARGQQLYAAGYRIVGRYLDEHLPPTDPSYLGKALKPTEPQTILNAGLRLFPLFQYNGTQLGNFTYEKGFDQGTKAHLKAIGYRLPGGTCIYFAVDYDALNVDIDSNIKPYFRGVKDALAEAGNYYSFGVYGSRNVCIRISREVGARWSMVSAMSWGYSGNLGFPLPDNWSFNQIREYNFQPGWGLDHDVWRDNADPGVSFLEPGQ
ncbi:glycoside hydrolase domain-containing protein [Micromonospora fulviviridis]|uniref:glycoside hydrolase domain-containing protein n=1 Tax=Micromonospora fulviviridis TaxID=47860 RepID=UPI003797E011